MQNKNSPESASDQKTNYNHIILVGLLLLAIFIFGFIIQTGTFEEKPVEEANMSTASPVKTISDDQTVQETVDANNQADNISDTPSNNIPAIESTKEQTGSNEQGDTDKQEIEENIQSSPENTTETDDDEGGDADIEKEEVAAVEETDDEALTDKYLLFNGEQFKQLFNEANLENLASLGEPPAITDNPVVDQRIRQIALDRGYRLRPMPLDESQLVFVEGDRHRLQPQAAQAYLDLRAAAAAEGLTIWIVSAYRNYDYQRNIFVNNVASPYTDKEVFEALKLISVPGYSRHHTGYTIDIAEGNYIFEAFADSKSYQWISANNYLNAKKHGWIPSYPPDGGKQGPDPEPWEFVYVGQEYLQHP